MHHQPTVHTLNPKPEPKFHSAGDLEVIGSLSRCEARATRNSAPSSKELADAQVKR